MKNKITYLLAVLIGILSVNTSYGQQGANHFDFSLAKIVIADQLSETERAALEMLVEEIEARTVLRLSITTTWPEPSVPVIAVGTKTGFNNYGEFDQNLLMGTSGYEAEGYSVRFIGNSGQAPTVFILGNDSRGMLYGVGYFLRKASMQPNIGNLKGKLLVPYDLDIDSHPVVALRGHQLGYRPKVNSYDGFTVAMWEQYIRDLIVFGMNAVELMPPHTDDLDEDPMFTLPQKEMMIEMNNVLAKYGLDTWIWYPLMHGDYSVQENIERSLEENESVFSQLKKVDAVFVPGGDPGHHIPAVLFAQLQRKAEVLHRYHPQAEIWVSPQGFSAEWFEELLQLVKEEPEWLTGIAHGPWIRYDIDGLREVIPEIYPIRRYPDITHTIDAQYFMRDWDYAHAATHGREPINPRPLDQAAVFHSAGLNNYYGFITYSEGVNDDVNKTIWSGLGWDPDAEVMDILRDYSRYFIGPEYADDFAQTLLNLEENWMGPLIGNHKVNINHMKFQAMEKAALPNVRLNWRFQQAQYRSYYDAYNRSRLIYETQLEDEAMSVLRRSSELGSQLAMRRASDVLNQAVEKRVSEDWRQRVFEIAEALFQSIRMQLSVDKYFAIDVVRGANLDLIDYPLNNRFWLEMQFARIAQIDNETARLNEIDKIVNWANPGPGGYYTDLGDLENQPHLVEGGRYEDDPNSYFSPFVGYAGGYSVRFARSKDWRVSWKRYMQTLYGNPLKMHFTGLDKSAQYQVKVTYIARRAIRLVADTDGEEVEIHDFREPSEEILPVTFDIPMEGTKDGEITLKWTISPEIGGAGRGLSVAEVWLIKKVH